jgi:L-lactate utilization protein LutC
MYFVSIVFGLILVISSLFMIRREFNRAVNTQAQMIEQSRVYKDADLFQLLENLQLSIDEMNTAFYDIAQDLEGKYSLHEKEIVDLNKALIQLQDRLSEKQAPMVNAVEENIKVMTQIKEQKKDMETTKEIREEKTDRRSEIIRLRSSGIPIAQIAKDLDMGVGEVQLLLRLKQ